MKIYWSDTHKDYFFSGISNAYPNTIYKMCKFAGDWIWLSDSAHQEDLELIGEL